LRTGRNKGALAKAGKPAWSPLEGTSTGPLVARRAEPAPPNADLSPNDSAAASPSSSPTVLRALPVTSSSPAVAIASTTGATWKTFAPGQLPAGRVLDTAGLRQVADNGIGGERVYLKGQFVVNFADGNRAVLRPTISGSTQRAGVTSRNARIIVDYPAGSPLPEPGSTLNRDDNRPYEITEVRRQSDGQLNVFVREIMKP